MVKRDCCWSTSFSGLTASLAAILGLAIGATTTQLVLAKFLTVGGATVHGGCSATGTTVTLGHVIEWDACDPKTITACQPLKLVQNTSYHMPL